MYCSSKLRGAVVLSILIVFPFYSRVHSQVRWDGGGGDGEWATAANWSNDILPSATDDVVLDNSLLPGNYTVLLPPGMTVIAVRSIIIQPLQGNKIELTLPSSNNAAPALIISGAIYGLVIQEGGIFRNASGISSGQSLQVTDSLRINNGGRYIHQTRASHAGSISQILSRDVGTETGIVEFDVPGTTGYTISASSRVYGTLVLSANAAGLSRTYSSSGSNDLQIRGDFILNTGVNYNLNLDGNIFVDRNLIHSGQTLNISSGGDTTILQLRGDLIQSGNITETSTGIAKIELRGTTVQQISITGNFMNNVGLKMNNAAGAVLQSPVSLPWKLELINGKITSTAAHLLILLPGCELLADSLSNNSFVNGPLRKEGLASGQHFIFPVGKDIYQRWLALKNATGNFTVEYFKADPRQLSANYDAGIDHISKLEYWTIESDSSSANPELSFTDPNSGGVTDLSSLRVAQLVNNIWIDAGNTAFSGTAGANGSVTGNQLSSFGYFTLAGSDASANPLPLTLTHFSATTDGHTNILSWVLNGEADYFEIMHSEDNRRFKNIGRVYSFNGRKRNQFKHMKTANANYYQLAVIRNNGNSFKSPVLKVTSSKNTDWLLSVAAGEQLTLTINASNQKSETAYIMDASGSMVKQFSVWLKPGINHINTYIGNLRPGVYSVRMRSNSMPFVKW